MSDSESRTDLVRDALAGLGVFGLSLVVLLLLRPAESRGPARIDEAEWLAIGVATWQLATTGEVPDRGATDAEREEAAADPWRTGICESTFGWMNPVFPKLAFGALAAASGVEHTSRAVFPRFRGPRTGPAARERARTILEPALGPARVLLAGLGALCVTAVFLVARAGAGTLAGLAAIALLLASPTFRSAATYVRTDLFPIAFGLLALALVQRSNAVLFGPGRERRALVACVALGGLAGLAVGSKLNGALTSFAVLGWFLTLPLLLRRVGGQRADGKRLLLRIAIVGGTCAGLFWLSLPSLWGADHPLQAVPELLERWRSSLEFQVQKSGGAAPAELLARAGLALRRALVDFEPLNELVGLPLGAPLAAAGLVALALRTRRTDLPRRLASAALAVHLLVVVLGTILWLPLDRERFFLPLLAPVVLLQVQVLAWPARRAN